MSSATASGIRSRGVAGKPPPDGSIQEAPGSSQRADATPGDALLLIRITVAVVGGILLCVAGVFLASSELDPEACEFKAPRAFEGPLKVNTRLGAAEKLLLEQISGPEAIAVQKGHIYTGTADGKVLKIHNGEVRVLARLGKEPCGGPEHEGTCGRPLGVRIDPNDGSLVVVDGSLGVYRVNTATGDHKQLMSSKTPIGGHASRFLNDVAVTSDGTMYVTDTSVKWDRRHFRMLCFDLRPDGRVLELQGPQSEPHVVCDGVYPNGIEVATSGDHVLICETSLARIVKCFIRGPRRGQTEVFIDNLPGYPDNIRRSSSGTYWVALTAARGVNGTVPLWERVSAYPTARRALFAFNKMAAGAAAFSQTLKRQVYGPQPVQGPPKQAGKLHGIVIEVSAEGQILRSLQDTTGRVHGISHVEEDDGTLYLGSATNNYIGRLKL